MGPSTSAEDKLLYRRERQKQWDMIQQGHRIQQAMAVCNTKHLVEYRERPTDIAYTQQTEIANCTYCRWRQGGLFVSDFGWRCTHPKQRYGRPSVPDEFTRAERLTFLTERPRHRGLCITWNCTGECTRYTLSRWTRILRRFGLRKPAWGEP